MDRPHLPPNTPRFVSMRIDEIRRVGRDLQFVVRPREHTGYELAVKYVDSHGLPRRLWLISNHNRDTLEQIREALEAQERDSNFDSRFGG
jgi:hypothetical protein